MTDNMFSVTALPGVPAIRPGDDLIGIIIGAMSRSIGSFKDGDVLVLAQKIVSKSEGRQIALTSISPSARAKELARETGKDPRIVELILSEAQQVVRVRQDLIIVRHRLGLTLANAGIDQSNVGIGEGYGSEDQVILLPVDPDSSAATLHEGIYAATGRSVAVLIIDSIGRAWRMGTIGTAIGVAGMPALVDLRGRKDLNGRALQSSELAWADEIAAAASLAMGQANEGYPVVLVRGLPILLAKGAAADLIRPLQMDLFQ
ncbi:coenzyme F420-0:L-glutamate ligase [Sphingosinicella soli]|uniref:Coenzyme F420-0:L-glutamate ligase/coenzyme F420-1:gamma-L-glutamate ligase n=1 Tax=Sphingosinicella soli TaxID=333708 RepID=A0A7W7F8S5_9SPHN|nr:coenzyme F420-0:L-glutamate ligase [Sphingosinicella soli]MBB4631943.1 coenzyme F420-0:L-glutamate ligase/coenzyme F420-1:gamma-L-glutamate ligase [Sphingosinicella soli]